LTNSDRRYWPDAGLTVMGLAAIIALAIAVSSYLSSDSEISAARGLIVVGGCGRRSLLADSRRRFAWPRRAFCRPMRSRSYGNLDCGLSS
jgi:hypothetical protein